jgi:peptidoglycan/xylan/chitin deacetylase (PgdA/CDA1 family)
MPRLACISIDLDELPHYLGIHGLERGALGEGGDTAVYRTALPRFLEICDRRGVASTLFCVGRDLGGDSAGLLRKAAGNGHELGNHTFWHDYQLSRSATAEISADLLRGAEAIRTHAGYEVRGFRAPGYTLSAALYQATVAQDYAYGSSAYPAAPYYLAKAAILGFQQLTGRTSSSALDSPAVLTAPTVPYLPDPEAPYRRGKGPVPELPITVQPGTRFPFIGTYVLTLPGPLMMAFYATVRGLDFLNLELHGVDFLDGSDGAGAELTAVQRDLKVPARRKTERFDELLGRIQADYEVVTLLAASKRVP